MKIAMKMMYVKKPKLEIDWQDKLKLEPMLADTETEYLWHKSFY